MDAPGTIRRTYRPRHSLLRVLSRIGMPILLEISNHRLYLPTQGFQLFQCHCQAVSAVHIQHASCVEVVGQIVELISNLTVLFNESRQFRRYHGNLLPADRPPFLSICRKNSLGDKSHLIAPFRIFTYSSSSTRTPILWGYLHLVFFGVLINPPVLLLGRCAFRPAPVLG